LTAEKKPNLPSMV